MKICETAPTQQLVMMIVKIIYADFSKASSKNEVDSITEQDVNQKTCIWTVRENVT